MVAWLNSSAYSKIPRLRPTGLPPPNRFAAGGLLQHHAAIMKSARPVPRHPVSEETVERVTVSLAQSDKTKLERIAEKKRVSLAWVVRDAITQYLTKSER